MYRIDKIFHNIKERKLAKRLCERERERESLAGILIASIKAMLYDRMCKKIFRVDGMLLPLPCIQASIRLFRLSYEKNWEKYHWNQMYVWILDETLFDACIQKIISFICIIIFHFLKENDKIASFLVYFCISWIRDSNRWNWYVTDVLRVSNSSNELEKSCNMIFVMVSC